MPDDLAIMLAVAESLLDDITFKNSADLPNVFDPFSCETIGTWRKKKARDLEHSLHRMMSRVGGFPPGLARYLVSMYSQPGDVVLDPFCGKGTTLLEAASLGRIAIGGDTAPDAVLVSRAKCSGVSVAEAVNYIEALDASRQARAEDVPSEVTLFYHPETLRELLAVRAQLLHDMGRRSRLGDIARFVCGVTLGILHGHSRIALSLPCNQCFAMSPQYVRRYVEENGLETPYRNVVECILARTLDLLPSPRGLGVTHVHEASATECYRYVREHAAGAHLVLFSPPYLARQTYVKDSWLRLWFLDRDRKAIADQSLETGSAPAYVDRMTSCFRSMCNSLRSSGYLIMVCGKATLGSGQSVRVDELCLYALQQATHDEHRLVVREVIEDSKVLERGSYFAVHGGNGRATPGSVVRRSEEERIIILQKDNV